MKKILLIIGICTMFIVLFTSCSIPHERKSKNSFKVNKAVCIYKAPNPSGDELYVIKCKITNSSIYFVQNGYGEIVSVTTK